MIKKYLLNILVSIDQFGNTITGGDPDETISSRVGKAAAAGSKFAKIAELLINCLFYPLQGWGHCRSKIEADEGKNAVV